MLLAIRGLLLGGVGGVVVAVGVMWAAGDLDRWQARTDSIALTILIFAFAGLVGGMFMGRR
jgi:hypothetical protein